MEKKWIFALDVDGVLTDGKFLWNKDGEKVYKEFGPDDADALKLLSKYMNIEFFSKDGKGYQISESRVRHMGFECHYMDTEERIRYLGEKYGLDNVIYMGDSFVDAPLLNECGCGIATSTSSFLAKHVADYVTTTGGGERAVAEAVFYIMKEVLKLKEVEIVKDIVLPLDKVRF